MKKQKPSNSKGTILGELTWNVAAQAAHGGIRTETLKGLCKTLPEKPLESGRNIHWSLSTRLSPGEGRDVDENSVENDETSIHLLGQCPHLYKIG